MKVSTSQLKTSSGSQTSTLNAKPIPTRNRPRRTAAFVIASSVSPRSSRPRIQSRKLTPARNVNSGAASPVGRQNAFTDRPPVPVAPCHAERFSVKCTTTMITMANARRTSIDVWRTLHPPREERRPTSRSTVSTATSTMITHSSVVDFRASSHSLDRCAQRS